MFERFFAQFDLPFHHAKPPALAQEREINPLTNLDRLQLLADDANEAIERDEGLGGRGVKGLVIRYSQQAIELLTPILSAEHPTIALFRSASTQGHATPLHLAHNAAEDALNALSEKNVT